MTRGSAIGGGDNMIRAPYAPDAKHIRRDFNSASMQTGSNTSPGLFVSVVAGSHGGEMIPQYSLPRRPFLLQFVIDVMAVFFAFLFVAVTGLGLAFAAYALLFLSF